MSADETNLVTAGHPLRTHCIACGCHDTAACWDEHARQPSHWLAVERQGPLGVCSACPEDLARWPLGDRTVQVPLEIELAAELYGQVHAMPTQMADLERTLRPAAANGDPPPRG